MPPRNTGRFERTTVAGEEVAAFVPAPLPPTEPRLSLTGPLQERLHAAERALERLEIAGEMVPSIDWFLYAFVRKEAVLSSQIEGTQATLIDLLTFEAGGADLEGEPDIEEVCNHLDALEHARTQIAAPDGLPLSMRLLNEVHARLMRGARGADKHPGEVRRTQNWIGGTRPGNAAYVPPPPDALPELLSDFEKYVHAPDQPLPPLVRAGLLHVQFESIHPYLDGNGRVGRLLVTLLLEHWDLLSAPLLYLSLFFKRHRDLYYERLDSVRHQGDWEGWTDFFLDGVATIAGEATETARDLFALVTEDRSRVLATSQASLGAIRLFEDLPRHPVVESSQVVERIQISKPTANRAIQALEAAGVLVEITGKKRDRQWAYQRYLDRLRAGTDL